MTAPKSLISRISSFTSFCQKDPLGEGVHVRGMGRKGYHDGNAVNDRNRNINELYINYNVKNPIYGTSSPNLPFINFVALFSVTAGDAL